MRKPSGERVLFIFTRYSLQVFFVDDSQLHFSEHQAVT